MNFNSVNLDQVRKINHMLPDVTGTSGYYLSPTLHITYFCMTLVPQQDQATPLHRRSLHYL